MCYQVKLIHIYPESQIFLGGQTKYIMKKIKFKEKNTHTHTHTHIYIYNIYLLLIHEILYFLSNI